MDDLIARIDRQINLMGGRGMPLHESQARDLLRECKEALSSQWVSVDDDEKPELHESVWIYTTDCDGVPIASVAHWNGHLGFLVTGGYKDPDVTHWKRIVPPIEQEQEK